MSSAPVLMVFEIWEKVTFSCLLDDVRWNLCIFYHKVLQPSKSCWMMSCGIHVSFIIKFYNPVNPSYILMSTGMFSTMNLM